MSGNNKAQISEISGVESTQPRERISLAIWSLSGIVIAACSNQDKFIEVPPDAPSEGSNAGGGGEGAASGFQVRVLDGPLQDAKVYVDINGDGQTSADELIATTDIDGLAYIPELHAGRAVLVDVSGSLDVLTDTIVSPNRETIYRPLNPLPQTSSISALLVTPLTELLASQSPTAPQAVLDGIFGVNVITVEDVLNSDNYHPASLSLEGQAISRAALALTELANDSTLTVGSTPQTATNLAKLTALFAGFRGATAGQKDALDGTAHAIDGTGAGTLATGTLKTEVVERVDKIGIPYVHEPNGGVILQGEFAGPNHVIFNFEDALRVEGSNPLRTDSSKAEALFGFQDPFHNPGGVTSAFYGIFIKATTAADNSVQIHYRDVDAENQDFWELLDGDRIATGDSIDLSMVVLETDAPADFHYVSSANFVNLAIVNLGNAAGSGEEYSFEYYVWDGQYVSSEVASLSIRIAVTDEPIFGGSSNIGAGITETDGNSEDTVTGITFTLDDPAGRGLLNNDADLSDFSVSDARFAVERVGVTGDNFRLVLRANTKLDHEDPLGTGVNHGLDGEIPITITYDNPADAHAAITLAESVIVKDLDEVPSFTMAPYEVDGAEEAVTNVHNVEIRTPPSNDDITVRNQQSTSALAGVAVPETDSRFGFYDKMLDSHDVGRGILGTLYYNDGGGAAQYVINTENPEAASFILSRFYAYYSEDFPNRSVLVFVRVPVEASRNPVLLKERGVFRLEDDLDDPDADGFSTTFEVIAENGNVSVALSRASLFSHGVIGEYGDLRYHESIGRWEYVPNKTERLIAREEASDVFTVRAVSSDGIAEETTLTVNLVGVNDLPYRHPAFDNNAARPLVNITEGEAEGVVIFGVQSVPIPGVGHRGHLHYLDHESSLPDEITYVITEIPEEGVTVYFNGDRVMSAFTDTSVLERGVNTFTQEDINQGRVTLKQNGDNPSADREIGGTVVGETALGFKVQDEHGGEVEGRVVIHVYDDPADGSSEPEPPPPLDVQ